MDKIKYTNGEITIIWQPKLCYHSGNCVRGLPNVFNAAKRPWIEAANATTEQLINQVNMCPSGALSFVANDRENDEKNTEDESAEVKISALHNGPLMIEGDFSISDSKGNVLEKKNKVALCRCGQSSNKPFCDGTHRKINFVAD